MATARIALVRNSGVERPLDEGARADLERVYRECGDELWRCVFAYAGGRAELADDSVAEAFTQAGRRIESIRDLRAWVFRAAFRIAAGELQRRGRPAAQHEVGVSDVSASASSVELIELLRMLSPNQRGALVLRDLYGYRSGEAGRMLGISEVAVRVHLHAARRRLRGLLEEVERS